MSDKYRDRMMTRESRVGWPGAAPQERATGVISFWNAERGWGFIRRSDGSPNIFCHINQVVQDIEKLTIGDRVTFTPGISRRTGKPEACDVRLID